MAKKKHPKLPNGFGSIKKLSGKRRNPYAVYPPAKERNDNGVSITPSALCYVSDWNIGFYALMEYKNGTFDAEKIAQMKIDAPAKSDALIEKILASYNTMTRANEGEKTFEEVYQEYYDSKYVYNTKRTYSRSSTDATKAAFNKFSALHKKLFRRLKTDDFQKVIDACPYRHASKEHMVNLIKQMYQYADAHDLCDKDYGAYVSVNVPDDDVPGEPFTKEEIELLWKNVDKNSVIKGILIMIYSGYRISAYRNLEVNLKERYFKGGVKTTAGKNRIVPINDIILPLVDKDMELFRITSCNFRIAFNDALAELGITGHTPHDCRHTFSWLCDVFKVDALSKRMLLGHKLGDNVTDSKYGHRTIDQLREEIGKIKKELP